VIVLLTVLFGVFAVLAGLQLWFYRQGDARASRSVKRHKITVNDPPVQLKSPKLRNIWKTLDQNRAMMKLKEKEAFEQEKKKEKERLNMPEEEEILFMDESSWALLRPVAAVSAVSFVLSALPFTPFPFVFLATGLCGLAAIAFMRGRSRYYLTNYRIITGGNSRAAGYSVVEYEDVKGFEIEESFSRGRLIVKGAGTSLEISGIKRPSLHSVRKLLDDRISNHRSVDRL